MKKTTKIENFGRLRIFEKNSKKAQIKMFETIAILIIFFILLMFGFMFYSRVQKSSYESEIEKSVVLQAVEVSQVISLLPELQCSKGRNIPESQCIDQLKLSAATEVINQNRQDYFDLFSYSNIYIEKIYPLDSGENTFILYDFPKNQDNGKISTQFPISLKNPITNKYYFAVLYVDIYR